MTYDGLILAGGASRRMGAHKPGLVVAGRTLLEVARAALAGAGQTVVVGPGGDLVEDPPGSGPVAAVRAGLALVSAPVVVLLAADLPFVTRAAVEALAAAAPAVAVDDIGRDQHLLAAYPTALLVAATAAAGRDRMREVTDTLCPRRISLPGEPWRDVDTPADLKAARSR